MSASFLDRPVLNSGLQIGWQCNFVVPQINDDFQHVHLVELKIKEP